MIYYSFKTFRPRLNVHSILASITQLKRAKISAELP